MLGDTRGQSSIEVLGEPMPVDTTQFPRFTGELPPAGLARIRNALRTDPATGTWLTRDIVQATAAGRKFRPVYKRRDAQSPAQEQKAREGVVQLAKDQERVWNSRSKDKRRDEFWEISKRNVDQVLAFMT